MTNVTALPLQQSSSGAYSDEFDIPAGEYEACVVNAATELFYFGRSPKVVLTFRILEQGRYYEKLVRGFYAVKSISGKPRRDGRFKVGPKSRLIRDVAKLLTFRPPTDRVPEEVKNCTCRIAVRRVEKVGKDKLAESMQYAVVDSVLQRIEG